MIEWIVSNVANLFVGAIVLVVIALAGRNVYKNRKSGGCSGCPSSSGCHNGCCNIEQKDNR